MFCRLLKPYPTDFVNAENPFSNDLMSLYEKKIFVIKEIKEGYVCFYLDQTFKNNMREIFRRHNRDYLNRELDDFVPRISKENVTILTFVDLWELKRNGNQDM